MRALTTPDDSRQVASAGTLIENGARVSILAFAETTWVLSTVYKLTPTGLATGIDMLLNHKHLTLQDSDTVALALELFRSRPTRGFF